MTKSGFGRFHACNVQTRGKNSSNSTTQTECMDADSCFLSQSHVPKKVFSRALPPQGANYVVTCDVCLLCQRKIRLWTLPPPPVNTISGQLAQFLDLKNLVSFYHKDFFFLFVGLFLGVLSVSCHLEHFFTKNFCHPHLFTFAFFSIPGCLMTFGALSFFTFWQKLFLPQDNATKNTISVQTVHLSLLVPHPAVGSARHDTMHILAWFCVLLHVYRSA